MTKPRSFEQLQKLYPLAPKEYLENLAKVERTRWLNSLTEFERFVYYGATAAGAAVLVLLVYSLAH